MQRPGLMQGESDELNYKLQPTIAIVINLNLQHVLLQEGLGVKNRSNILYAAAYKMSANRGSHTWMQNT